MVAGRPHASPATTIHEQNVRKEGGGTKECGQAATRSRYRQRRDPGVNVLAWINRRIGESGQIIVFGRRAVRL